MRTTFIINSLAKGACQVKITILQYLEIFIKFCGLCSVKIIHKNQKIYMVDTFILINPQNFKPTKIPAIYGITNVLTSIFVLISLKHF